LLRRESGGGVVDALVQLFGSFVSILHLGLRLLLLRQQELFLGGLEGPSSLLRLGQAVFDSHTASSVL
jgi:hypothetical protein